MSSNSTSIFPRPFFSQLAAFDKLCRFLLLFLGQNKIHSWVLPISSAGSFFVNVAFQWGNLFFLFLQDSVESLPLGQKLACRGWKYHIIWLKWSLSCIPIAFVAIVLLSSWCRLSFFFILCNFSQIKRIWETTFSSLWWLSCHASFSMSSGPRTWCPSNLKGENPV